MTYGTVPIFHIVGKSTWSWNTEGWHKIKYTVVTPAVRKRLKGPPKVSFTEKTIEVFFAPASSKQRVCSYPSSTAVKSQPKAPSSIKSQVSKASCRAG